MKDILVSVLPVEPVKSHKNKHWLSMVAQAFGSSIWEAEVLV